MNYKQWVALLLLIIGGVYIGDTFACEPNGHAYLNLGIGKTGTWLNDNPDVQDEWDDDVLFDRAAK